MALRALHVCMLLYKLSTTRQTSCVQLAVTQGRDHVVARNKLPATRQAALHERSTPIAFSAAQILLPNRVESPAAQILPVEH